MKGHLVCYGKKINLAGKEEFMNILYHTFILPDGAINHISLLRR